MIHEKHIQHEHNCVLAITAVDSVYSNAPALCKYILNTPVMQYANYTHALSRAAAEYSVLWTERARVPRTNAATVLASSTFDKKQVHHTVIISCIITLNIYMYVCINAPVADDSDVVLRQSLRLLPLLLLLYRSCCCCCCCELVLLPVTNPCVTCLTLPRTTTYLMHSVNTHSTNTMQQQHTMFVSTHIASMSIRYWENSNCKWWHILEVQIFEDYQCKLLNLPSTTFMTCHVRAPFLL